MLKPSKMFRRASWFIALLASVCVVRSAEAVNHGNFTGPNVMYLNVRDEAQVKIPGSLPSELFGVPNNGNPVLPSDDLIFYDIATNNPPTKLPFNASSSGGGLGYTDGFLSTTIMSNNPALAISSLVVKEFGGYSLAFGTPAGTIASVSMDTIKATVREINGVPVAPFDLPRTINYVNLGGAPSTTAFGGIQFSTTGGVTLGQGWSATATFNLAAAPGVTKIDLTLDNALLASTDSLNALASIDKKGFEITTDVVPEPGTIILGLVGGLGMVLVGRRSLKKQQVA